MEELLFESNSYPIGFELKLVFSLSGGELVWWWRVSRIGGRSTIDVREVFLNELQPSSHLLQALDRAHRRLTVCQK